MRFSALTFLAPYLHLFSAVVPFGTKFIIKISRTDAERAPTNDALLDEFSEQN